MFFFKASPSWLYLKQQGLASIDFSESGTLSHCAGYSSSFILLVWAWTTAQSNPCQHPLPELLFSLITIMSRGMGRAGGGLWTHSHSKERNKDIYHFFYLFLANEVAIIHSLKESWLLVWSISGSAFWTHAPFDRDRNTSGRNSTNVC